MDTHQVQAKFPTQEQAESAVRKLNSLRGDCFRLEREGTFALTANVPVSAAEQARSVIADIGGEIF